MCNCWYFCSRTTKYRFNKMAILNVPKQQRRVWVSRGVTVRRPNCVVHVRSWRASATRPVLRQVLLPMKYQYLVKIVASQQVRTVIWRCYRFSRQIASQWERQPIVFNRCLCCHNMLLLCSSTSKGALETITRSQHKDTRTDRWIHTLLLVDV